MATKSLLLYKRMEVKCSPCVYVIYGYVMTVILGIEHSNHKVAII